MNTGKQFERDMASIQEQIVSNDKKLKKLKDIKYQHQKNAISLGVPI